MIFWAGLVLALFQLFVPVLTDLYDLQLEMPRPLVPRYLRFTVPVLAVFYGTSLIADEIEDKTITYLFTRPIPRGAVMAGKYLAYLACTSLVVLPSSTSVSVSLVALRRFRRLLSSSATSAWMPILPQCTLIISAIWVKGMNPR